MISERSGQLQELRRQLSTREQELNDVNRERERDVSASRELQRLQDVLKEKDAFIQVTYTHTHAHSSCLPTTQGTQLRCPPTSGLRFLASNLGKSLF